MGNQVKYLSDFTVLPGEECVPQHKLLVSDILLNPGKTAKHKFVPKPRIWRLKNQEVKQEFENNFASLMNSSPPLLNDSKPDVENL